jgi:hypothetical protein
MLVMVIYVTVSVYSGNWESHWEYYTGILMAYWCGRASVRAGRSG